jgi:hypothetical protein
MADGQSLPQFPHAFECIGSIPHYFDQGIVFRLEKSLIDSHVEKAQKVIVVPASIYQYTRFCVDPQLPPGKDFKKLVERAETARQSNKGISFLSHQCLALVHGFDQNQLAQMLMRNFDPSEGTGNHADDFAAMGERGVGQCAHQPHLCPAVYQAQSSLSQQSAQRDCLRMGRLLYPRARSTKNTNSPSNLLIHTVHIRIATQLAPGDTLVVENSSLPTLQRPAIATSA